MTHTGKIRWGIIGCGNVTEHKSGPAFQKATGSKLVAVMRRNRELAKDYAERHGVPKYYSDADELIRDPDVDAVYVATPPDTHKLYALKVAAAGKDCCVEKPMALNYAECIEMNESFARAGRSLFVAYYRRSLPRFAQVKQWLDERQIGDVRHVHWSFTRMPTEADLQHQPNWRTAPDQAGGGYFVDLASHGLDLFLHFFGNVENVRGVAANQQKLYEAEDAVSACWDFAGGATGSGFWNFGTGFNEDSVTIYGSEGKIGFPIFGDAVLELSNRCGRQALCVEHPEHIQFHHVQNMIRHLQGETKHPSTGQEAAQTSLFMDRILGIRPA
jgi:1,5-anhydro-D-fructose reductase (1,5-anhydro-D-mannitol-forming)